MYDGGRLRLEPLPKYLGDRLSGRNLILRLKRTELADHQALLDSREYRFDDRGFQQPSPLPLVESHLTRGRRRAKLAGNRHNHQIGLGVIIGLAADHDRRALLGGGLIREWERPGTTAPNSSRIVNVVFRVAPDRGKGRQASGGGIARSPLADFEIPAEVCDLPGGLRRVNNQTREVAPRCRLAACLASIRAMLSRGPWCTTALGTVCPAATSASLLARASSQPAGARVGLSSMLGCDRGRCVRRSSQNVSREIPCGFGSAASAFLGRALRVRRNGNLSVVSRDGGAG